MDEFPTTAKHQCLFTNSKKIKARSTLTKDVRYAAKRSYHIQMIVVEKNFPSLKLKPELGMGGV
jgi:hypothetical protein